MSATSVNVRMARRVSGANEYNSIDDKFWHLRLLYYLPGADPVFSKGAGPDYGERVEHDLGYTLSTIKVQENWSSDSQENQ